MPSYECGIFECGNATMKWTAAAFVLTLIGFGVLNYMGSGGGSSPKIESAPKRYSGRIRPWSESAIDTYEDQE